MSSKKILFLHGFMGFETDGSFLKSLGQDLYTISVPHSQNIDLNKLFDAIDLIRPDVIYGYSLGGRLALRYLKERKPKLESLFLESTSFGLLSGKEERLTLDHHRAQAIRDDLKEFLVSWYDMKLWGDITSKKRQEFVDEKYKRWHGKEEELAHAIITYSPGHWPSFRPTDLTCQAYYFYGEHDLVYQQQAKLLNNVIIHEIQGAGHCIHKSDQCGELLSKMTIDLKL
jgi:pimeloyl-ACP methyl ester carboxylesterase